MKEVAVLPDDERDAVFRNTAEKTSLTPAIVEKDFWVCWTLDYLFHQSTWIRQRITAYLGREASVQEK